jgi:hypothetical protein
MQKERAMSLRLAETTLDLDEHEVIRLNEAEGLAVACLDGAVWITQADDPDDVVLKPGQAFVIDRPGLTLVSAPGSRASIMIRPARNEARRIGPTAHVLRPAA